MPVNVMVTHACQSIESVAISARMRKQCLVFAMTLAPTFKRFASSHQLGGGVLSPTEWQT